VFTLLDRLEVGRFKAMGMIIHGNRDPLYLNNSPVKIHSAIPQSFLWVVPNSGHVPVFGLAARFVQTAIPFLRGDREKKYAK
jgi:pimeloyl-ACP methyl ester carboxylesterase